MFVIANAYRLPYKLQSLAAHVTMNFPWGSLLEGLLADDPGLMVSLTMVTLLNSTLEVRLKSSALAEAGWSLEAGAYRIQDVLRVKGFAVQASVTLKANELKTFPTTWAKRLAFGRDPRAVYLRAIRNVDLIAQIA